jgi:undecaprenyl-diphosphatase
MGDFFYSIDRNIFHFINTSLANPVSDIVFPFFSNLTQTWYGISILSILWLILFFKGGKKGKMVALLLIPVVTCSDQVSSTLVKKLIARPRPCHILEGRQVVDQIHLLLPCGSGYSFPSSHATNAFAVSTFVAYYFKRWKLPLFIFASAVALSRVVVGVHYPSDIVCGALLGASIAYIVITIWTFFERRILHLQLTSTPTMEKNGNE